MGFWSQGSGFKVRALSVWGLELSISSGLVDVNHCRSAKFRGLMCRVKYSAVIGRKTRFFVCAQYEFPGYGFFSTYHSVVFTPVHQATGFRQTPVRMTVVGVQGYTVDEQSSAVTPSTFGGWASPW
jgi:hypothetical protein